MCRYRRPHPLRCLSQSSSGAQWVVAPAPLEALGASATSRGRSGIVGHCRHPVATMAPWPCAHGHCSTPARGAGGRRLSWPSSWGHGEPRPETGREGGQGLGLHTAVSEPPGGGAGPDSELWWVTWPGCRRLSFAGPLEASPAPPRDEEALCRAGQGAPRGSRFLLPPEDALQGGRAEALEQPQGAAAVPLRPGGPEVIAPGGQAGSGDPRPQAPGGQQEAPRRGGLEGQCLRGPVCGHSL